MILKPWGKNLIFLLISLTCCHHAQANGNGNLRRHLPSEATSDTPPPVYFEESWAILSSIGVINVLFGFVIIGIIEKSPIAAVPIVVSAAGAIANGLCYYAFYADYAISSTIAAAAIGDIMWLIQEAGMSFYSYLILIRVLRNRPRFIFLSIFWGLMAIVLVLRMLILICRANDLSYGAADFQSLVNQLHIGYFGALAVIECVSTFFLLRKFAAAIRTSVNSSSHSGIFPYLMKSTEVRLATLSMIGVTRAITYSLQTTAQRATSVSGQVDRFVYTLECMFPIMMYIDILGSRLIATNHHRSHSPIGTFAISKTWRRHQSLDGRLFRESRPWMRSKTQSIASTLQEDVSEAMERQKAIDGFDFSFETQDRGISKTVDLRTRTGTLRT